jgi:hypothetical protein
LAFYPAALPVALLSMALGLSATDDGPGQLPPRHAYEMYGSDCAALARALPYDYRAVALRRIREGRNVFIYTATTLGSAPPIYPGLYGNDTSLALPARAREAIMRGGSWGLTFPDVACTAAIRIDEDQLIRDYNRYALTLIEAG